MLPNRWIFVLLAAGCLAAAAGGGYLAVREHMPRAAVPAVAAEGQPTPSPASPAIPAATTQPTEAAPAAPAQPSHTAKRPGTTTAQRVEHARVNEPRPQPQRRTAPAPVAREAQAQPAPADHTVPMTHVRPVLPAVPSVPKPTYGPVADPQPIAAGQWALLEQSWPTGDPGPPPPPPAPQLPPIEQYVLPADSVIGLEIDTPLSSETAEVEDPVEARVTRDVKVGDQVAIPAGTRITGVVVEVDRGGKFRARARLGIEFDTISMADGSELSIRTAPIYRDGPSPADASSAKISASTVAGTILGAIFGGAKGALIGGATGAAGGTAMVEAGGRQPATFPAGTPVTVQLERSVTITSGK